MERTWSSFVGARVGDVRFGGFRKMFEFYCKKDYARKFWKFKQKLTV